MVAKIPNQVKIDNEGCITLDKSANITSISGNVKNLLKHIVGQNKITETEDGIKFTSYQKSSCPKEYLTYYNGENGTLKKEELLAFYNHTIGKKNYILNTIIENLEFDTEFNFDDNLSKNVTFKGGNLSEVTFKNTTTGSGYIKIIHKFLGKSIKPA